MTTKEDIKDMLERSAWVVYDPFDEVDDTVVAEVRKDYCDEYGDDYVPSVEEVTEAVAEVNNTVINNVRVNLGGYDSVEEEKAEVLERYPGFPWERVEKAAEEVYAEKDAAEKIVNEAFETVPGRCVVVAAENHRYSKLTGDDLYKSIGFEARCLYEDLTGGYEIPVMKDFRQIVDAVLR